MSRGSIRKTELEVERLEVEKKKDDSVIEIADMEDIHRYDTKANELRRRVRKSQIPVRGGAYDRSDRVYRKTSSRWSGLAVRAILLLAVVFALILLFSD